MTPPDGGPVGTGMTSLVQRCQNTMDPSEQSQLDSPVQRISLDTLEMRLRAMEQRILHSGTVSVPHATSSLPVDSTTGTYLTMRAQGIKLEVAMIEPVIPTDSAIFEGATFDSFAEFESEFHAWKEETCQPFRIGSSDCLKDLNGLVDEKFRYRRLVFNCAHYGQPRMRGRGARPNQGYLPCGCNAVVRVAYNCYNRKLRITAVNIQHSGHPLTPEHYRSTYAHRRKYELDRYYISNTEFIAIYRRSSLLNTSSTSISSSESYVMDSGPSSVDVFKVKPEPLDYILNTEDDHEPLTAVPLSMIEQLEMTEFNEEMKKKNDQLISELIAAQKRTNHLLQKLRGTIGQRELSKMLSTPDFSSLLETYLPNEYNSPTSQPLKDNLQTSNLLTELSLPNK